MSEASAGEKTLPASPRKKEQARQKGNVPKSQDLTAAVTLLVALMAMRYLGPGMMEDMVDATAYYLGNAHTFRDSLYEGQSFAMGVSLYLARIVLPFMVIMAVAGAAINIVQFGFLFSVEAISPKFSKINPITGMQRFVSARTLVEFIKSMLKLIIVGTIVWMALRDRWPELIKFMELGPVEMIGAAGTLIFSVWWRIVLAMLVLGLFDYGFQRWQHERELRMTVQESREEMKQFEGDPRVRQRIRAVQRQMAMQRMMTEIPTADVVITNPTTYAVALRYDEAKMGAPVVIAKGARLIAERIRESAMTHDVPIVQKPDLARSIYRTVDIGKSVPEDLFRAVAEVLAYVYKIDRRAEKLKERGLDKSMQRAV